MLTLATATAVAPAALRGRGDPVTASGLNLTRSPIFREAVTRRALHRLAALSPDRVAALLKRDSVLCGLL
jgi:hypothetical protein